MNRAAVRRVVHLLAHRLDLLHRRVAQRLDFREVLLQHGQRFFALADAVGILAARELVLFVAVADHERHGGVAERNQLALVGTAVDEEEIAAHSARGDELVHDSAGHVSEVVLGGLAEKSAIFGGDRLVQKLLQEHGDSDLEGGRAAETASERNVGDDGHVEADLLDIEASDEFVNDTLRHKGSEEKSTET